MVRLRIGVSYSNRLLKWASTSLGNQLDAAVFAAYGWQPDLNDEAILAALLELNQQRAA